MNEKHKVILTMTLALISVLGINADDLAKYVNPFIGATTNSSHSYHGLGKTFPGATTPFGMVQVSPNTITGGDNGSGYSYEHTSIEGFAMTQMSGVGWYGDLGNFLVMPTTGQLKTKAGKSESSGDGYRSRYAKESEIAQVGYYSTLLSDYNIKAEATATPRCGMLRFTFPENETSRIQIDLARRVGGTSTLQSVKVEDEYSISGWMKCTPEGGGWGNGDGKPDYTVYFYARFSHPLKNYGFWSADIPDDWKRRLENVTSDEYQQRVAEAKIIRNIPELEGKHLGFFTEFPTRKNEVVTLKVGISFVDVEGAKNNFREEIEPLSFNEVKMIAYTEWNQELSRITVKGGSEDQKTIFYTALYHTMIDPRLFLDFDGRYIGGDKKIHKADKFQKRTIFSGWDVFRSQFPLLTIINPGVVNDEINSLVTLAEETGTEYFDRWEFFNSYSGCMVGNPAISIITDAYEKGIRNYRISKAYQYACNTALKFGNNENGYSSAPYSISNTLEYAYADWCMSVLAKTLKQTQDAIAFGQKAKAYEQIFDKELNWFRPKADDGSWEPLPEKDFRTTEWYGCIESNPYQQGWFVPHDVDGMVGLMGGKKKVLADLTDFFEKTPDNLFWNEYYNHANEPVHHVPFLFNRLGSPRLTQKWTRHICEKAYHNSVEGLVGNEDAGQMSAWYVLAAAGIHPICPGEAKYEITSPIFDEVIFNLDSGKKFVITTTNNSAENIYIESMKLNGKKHGKYQIEHRDITDGGILELKMTNK